MADSGRYSVEPLVAEGRLADLVFTLGAKTWRLWGRSGETRELELAGTLETGALPVLIGSGLGVCLETLLEAGLGPVAVVDRERAVWGVTGVRARYEDDPRVLWLDGEAEEVLKALEAWREERGGGVLQVLAVPLYLRLDREHYRAVAERIAAGRRADFWARAKYPKFASASPRILLLERKYFLYREIRSALSRMGVEHLSVPIGEGDRAREGFVEDLLKAVVEFKPDFALTVNHLGMDREGRLAGLLDRLNLPLASWFVDNPHLILHRYAGLDTERTVLFTWDADTVPSLTERGFANVHYLPLATDEARFFPGAPRPEGYRPDGLANGVAFVGASMVSQAAERLAQADPGPELAGAYADLAAGFSASDRASVPEYLAEVRPDLYALYEALPTAERKLSFEALVTWEATRRYRAGCVERLLEFDPVVVGDAGWSKLLPGLKRLRPPLDYYRDLPGFYRMFTVNFNCTSKQMKGAVNQRVFDVPACGGFVLTDRRPQLDDLFEPGRESAVYDDPEDIPGLVRWYLQDHQARRAVSEAARARVLAEHTYVHRLARMLDIMRDTWASR